MKALYFVLVGLSISATCLLAETAVGWQEIEEPIVLGPKCKDVNCGIAGSVAGCEKGPDAGPSTRCNCVTKPVIDPNEPYYCNIVE